MVDIATLSYSVDSSSLKSAEQALDSQTQAAERTTAATDKMAERFDAMSGELRSLNQGQSEFVGVAGQMRDILARMEEIFQKVAQGTVSHAAASRKAAESMAAQADAAVAAAAAADELDARYKQVARSAIEFAESMRTTEVSERALAEAAAEAASGIDVRAQIMERAGSEAERMAQRVEAMRQADERAARAAAEAARQTALQELSLSKLLGQIDPTIAKLERLGELEGQLEKALDLGAIKPEVFDHYQGVIDATRDAMLGYTASAERASRVLGRLNVDHVRVQQSAAALMRSLAQGHWNQVQLSVTSLAARTGFLSAAFSSAGLAVGGLAAGVGFFSVQAAKGYFEGRRLEGVILGTGSAAGVTAGQMLELRNEIGRTTGDYQSATRAINQLALSGKVTGEALELVARSAANIAKLTGQEIGTVTSELIGLSGGGSEALERWNDKYNVLNASTWQQIEAIRAAGGELAAHTAAVEEADRVYAERLQKMEERANGLETAWRNVKTAFREYMDGMTLWGRNDIEAQIAKKQRELQDALSGGHSGNINRRRVERLQEELGLLLQQQSMEQGREAREAANERSHMAYMKSAMQSERERKAAMDASHRKRVEEEERAEEAINRQIQSVYGLDTAVNRLETTFGRMSLERQQAMVADGTYNKLLSRAMEEDQKRADAGRRNARDRRAQLSEEERAVERLLSQFQRQEASMEREIALFGDSSRASAMAYDIQVSGLADVDAELARILKKSAEWLDFLDDMAALDKVWDEVAAEHGKYAEKVAGQNDFMSEHAKQAARNMQSHFANFLFDPFADGTKSMATAFSETLRRMMAEAMSSRIFEMVGGALSGQSGVLGWIGGLMSPGKREHGGPVYGGRMYQVGERNKPELLRLGDGQQYLIPGDHGKVTPMGHAAPRTSNAPMQVIINNNAPGVRAEPREERIPTGDGYELRRLVVDVIAGDFAEGGRSLAALKARTGIRDQV